VRVMLQEDDWSASESDDRRGPLIWPRRTCESDQVQYSRVQTWNLTADVGSAFDVHVGFMNNSTAHTHCTMCDDVDTMCHKERRYLRTVTCGAFSQASMRSERPC